MMIQQISRDLILKFIQSIAWDLFHAPDFKAIELEKCDPICTTAKLLLNKYSSDMELLLRSIERTLVFAYSTKSSRSLSKAIRGE